MITQVALDTPLSFVSVLQLSFFLGLRVLGYVLSYFLAIFSSAACFVSVSCNSERFLVNLTGSCFGSISFFAATLFESSFVSRALQKPRIIGSRARRGLLGRIRPCLASSYPLIQKLYSQRQRLLRWTTPDTLNASVHSDGSTDNSSASITISITTDTPTTSNSPSTDDSTKLNALLESSSGSFVDVPITPPTSPTDVLTNFAYTLSPATPASPGTLFLSPPTPCTLVSSEGSTLVTEDSEEILKSASAVSTPKRRQPFAELPIPNAKSNSKTKQRSKSESSPPLLKAPDCKVQTSSSTGKENLPPPQLPKSQNQILRTKGFYYRKDTFMKALKMDMIPVGEGGFGQVFRATATGNRTIAVKLMQRGVVTQEIAIVNEVQALRAAKGCKWAVELIYFQAAQEQALIALTYLPGGDMHSYWEHSGFCLEFKTAQFYIAQLILAIHDLHSRGIIHRDIKLENMMLDSQHNLKLVDFGLAQVFNHATVSEKDFPLFHQLRKLGGDAFPLLWATTHNPHQTDLANGTEGYAPPEVWKCQSHSFGIDYFAMGCVLHMLITGNAPFEFNQATQHYAYNNISVDKTMDVDAYDFLLKVLAPSPMNRLNVRRMKLHPVFRGIDWNALAAGSIEAPPGYPRVQ